MIRTVVGRELVFLAIDPEPALRDAVAVAADDRAEERVTGEISVNRIEPEHDVAHRARAIGRLDRRDDAAVGDRARFDAVLVGQRELLDRTAGDAAECFTFHDGPRWSGGSGRHRGRRAYKPTRLASRERTMDQPGLHVPVGYHLSGESAVRPHRKIFWRHKRAAWGQLRCGRRRCARARRRERRRQVDAAEDSGRTRPADRGEIRWQGKPFTSSESARSHRARHRHGLPGDVVPAQSQRLRATFSAAARSAGTGASMKRRCALAPEPCSSACTESRSRRDRRIALGRTSAVTAGRPGARLRLPDSRARRADDGADRCGSGSPVRCAARAKRGGTTILYVSHRLPEVFRLCDRITVLRDGSFVDTFTTGDVDTNDIVKAMVEGICLHARLNPRRSNAPVNARRAFERSSTSRARHLSQRLPEGLKWRDRRDVRPRWLWALGATRDHLRRTPADIRLIVIDGQPACSDRHETLRAQGSCWCRKNGIARRCSSIWTCVTTSDSRRARSQTIC